VERFCRELKKKVAVLSPEASQDLQRYPWPGNVRELQNCIERAVILTDGDTIHPRHLNLLFHAPAAAAEEPSPWSCIDLSGSLAEASRRVLVEVERRKIEQALREAGGNKGRVSEILQVSYKSLLMKLKEHGIE
jgi:DNA-binding NtrC family response regulator